MNVNFACTQPSPRFRSSREVPQEATTPREKILAKLAATNTSATDTQQAMTDTVHLATEIGNAKGADLMALWKDADVKAAVAQLANTLESMQYGLDVLQGMLGCKPRQK